MARIASWRQRYWQDGARRRINSVARTIAYPAVAVGVGALLLASIQQGFAQ
jgi:hypothetical protein